MNDWNDKAVLHAWVDNAAYAADVPEQDKTQLANIGHRVVDQGGLRGDVSEAWRAQYPEIDGALIDFYP
jgi:hypothetical protein